MDLLDLGSQEYWDHFYRRRTGKPVDLKDGEAGCIFDWIATYEELRGLIHQHLDDMGAKILELGCGNSDLCKGMIEDGFEKITAVDISPVVIMQLHKRHPSARFVCADVRDLKDFEDGCFDHCIEKGCIDALASLDDGAFATKLAVKETLRVLKDGGKFVQISMNKERRRDVAWARAGKWDLLDSGLISTSPGEPSGSYHVCKKRDPKGKQSPAKPAPKNSIALPTPAPAQPAPAAPTTSTSESVFGSNPAVRWTSERDALLQTVVEEYMYDFDAAALAVRRHIGGEGTNDAVYLDATACRLRYAHLHNER
jgi:SAM-dependent methyltransferase